MSDGKEAAGRPGPCGTVPVPVAVGSHDSQLVSDNRFVLGVVSDARVSDRTDRGTELADFARYAHARGARQVVLVGAVLAGGYRRSYFEVSLRALEREASTLDAALPPQAGLFYALLGGPPGELGQAGGWFDEASYLARFFRSRRSDVLCFGPPGVFLALGGVLVHLWNPEQAFGRYAEAKILSKLASYPADRKPALLLVGRGPHLVHSSLGDVEALCCPPFGQGAGAGGLLLSWTPGGSRPLGDLRVELRRGLADRAADAERALTVRGTSADAVPGTGRLACVDGPTGRERDGTPAASRRAP